MNDQREQRVMPTVIGLPADDDIFTDNVRFGDMDAWNRAALRIHEEHDGFHRIEREGFPPILAVLGHASVLEVERQLLRRIPPQYLLHAHHWLILHGRYVCLARKPRCAHCAVRSFCDFPDKVIASDPDPLSSRRSH